MPPYSSSNTPGPDQPIRTAFLTESGSIYVWDGETLMNIKNNFFVTDVDKMSFIDKGPITVPGKLETSNTVFNITEVGYRYLGSSPHFPESPFEVADRMKSEIALLLSGDTKTKYIQSGDTIWRIDSTGSDFRIVHNLSDEDAFLVIKTQSGKTWLLSGDRAYEKETGKVFELDNVHKIKITLDSDVPLPLLDGSTIRTGRITQVTTSTREKPELFEWAGYDLSDEIQAMLSACKTLAPEAGFSRVYRPNLAD